MNQGPFIIQKQKGVKGMEDNQQHKKHSENHSQHGQDHENGHQGEKHEDHHDHHAMMVADFKRRFFVSFVLMIPILGLSPMIQNFMGVEWRFAGDSYLLFGLSTVLFFYGG